MRDVRVNIGTLNATDGATGVRVSQPEATLCTLPSVEEIPFVGRTNELAVLDTWLRGTQRVLVVHGPPGVGKSRLAVQWVHAQGAAFPGGRYFLSFRADPHEALHTVARLREMPRLADERLDEWAMRTLHHVGADDALVIFDDIQSPPQFAEWFGRMSRARAIVVTNERVWPAGYAQLAATEMELADARELARRAIGDDVTADLHADVIVQRAGRNAVQIVVDAGAAREASVLGESPSWPPVPAPEATESFERAWRAASDEARQFVCALALYRAQGTPLARVAEVLGVGDEATAGAAAAAVRRHLASRDPERRLTMHPLLREFARAKARAVLTSEMRERHAHAFVTRAREFDKNPGDRAKYTEFAYDESDAKLWAERTVTLSSHDQHAIGNALFEAGRFVDALPWFEKAVDAQRQGDVHGRIDHQSLGVCLHEVGNCLSQQGKYADALPWFEEAVEARRQGDMHGHIDHQSLGVSLHEVGNCFSQQGKYADALPWYEKAVEAKRQGDAHGRIDHQSLGVSLHEVGNCLTQQGKYTDALPWYEKAVEAQRQGDVRRRLDQQSLGMSLHEVGNCLSQQGKYADALPWYKKAVEAKRQGDVHGRINHQSLGVCLHEVGFCLSQQGKHADALPWLEKAVEVQRQGDVHGRINHQSLGVCLHEVGHCLSQQGKYADALPWYKKAVEAQRHGDVHRRIDHQSLGVSLHQVGHCLSQQGKYADALPWYEKAIEAKQQGDVHGRIDQQSLGVSENALRGCHGR